MEDHGHQTTWSQKTDKELAGVQPSGNKTRALEDFDQMMGFGTSSGSAGPAVKSESPEKVALGEWVEKLRSAGGTEHPPGMGRRLCGVFSGSRAGDMRWGLRGGFDTRGWLCSPSPLRTVIRGCQSAINALTDLSSKLLARGEKETDEQKMSLFKKYGRECDQSITALTKFTKDCLKAVAEAELSEDAADCKRMSVKMTAMVTTGDHHISGAKAAKTRYTSNLAHA